MLVVVCEELLHGDLKSPINFAVGLMQRPFNPALLQASFEDV